MVRKLRLQYEGAIYHLTVRGVEQRRLFDDDQDRIRDVHTDVANRVKQPGDVAFRQVRRTVHPEAVLEAVARDCGEAPERLRQRRYNCLSRGVVAHLLGRYAGLNQRDIGAWLAMETGATVSA